MSRTAAAGGVTTLGLGHCPLVLGECVQGRLRDRGHFLITAPVNTFSWAEFAPDPALGRVVVDPPERTKSLAAVTRFLSAAGRPASGALKVFTPVRPGLGFGTSTADITASIRAAAAAWGEVAAPEVISAIATTLEPTDGSMYPGSVAFDHRRGLLLERLGPLPLFYALVVCAGSEVDTVAYDACRKDYLYSPDDERELRLAWDMVRHAARTQDLSVLASACTLSARINEQLLPKPYFHEMYEFMELTGLEGLIVGHSGALLAFLLDPSCPGFFEKLDQTRKFASDLCTGGWLEISNSQLARESRWGARRCEEAGAALAGQAAGAATPAERATPWP
jgi:uncharacterized protein involved in propanediol utilization